MKKFVTGILAHVDAGKTTLSEAMLYLAGDIRKLGRVDHKDAFLDTYALERERGITIFSKQAILHLNEQICSTLLDTPGHVDFSAEMERTLQVLDYAVLVISGTDGVQGHTETLWKLLKRYNIPTFIFVNKMDISIIYKGDLMNKLKSKLDINCVDFSCFKYLEEESVDYIDKERYEQFLENVATCDENVLEHFMLEDNISIGQMVELVNERKLFPCFFGSALKVEGVEELLEGMSKLTREKKYPEEFGARVYKISRDNQGNRLTYMKITGGTLKVKAVIGEEKVNQIRIYSGNKFEAVNEIGAGEVCAVTGLENTKAGQGLGNQVGENEPILEPVLNYQIVLPKDCDAHVMYGKLKEVEEEDPLLNIIWNEQAKEIHAQLMGDIQIEILQSMIQERFGVNVTFGQGSIVYKETIKNTVEGIGHFEPLRHYAEVHILMEPGEEGSGIVIDTNCKEDDLDKNWQRLILTHLNEKNHVGVLTGSHITDIKFTLIGGRAHAKHTEGGDFRQATYRAVRNGLKKAESILLEPYYEFILEVPSENVGRAMNDISMMKGEFETPLVDDDTSVIKGNCPVSTMNGYIAKVNTYTRGSGKLVCNIFGYKPCHNQDEVAELIGYDSERDVENPTGSVFCAHGAGFNVEWDKVKDYAHVDTGFEKNNGANLDDKDSATDFVKNRQNSGSQTQYETPSYDSNGKWQMGASYVHEKELQQIFEKQFGPVKRRLASDDNFGYERKKEKEYVYKERKIKDGRKNYLLVDGYNVIFAWEDLNELAKDTIDGARYKLMDILSNYQGYKGWEIILVFDAYKVKGNPGEISKYHNINVVYTKEAETADQYIEHVTHEIGTKHNVTVATSDRLEQMIVMSRGAIRMSSRELLEEVKSAHESGMMNYKQNQEGSKQYLDHLLKNI